MAQLGPLLCEACQRLPPVLDETVALFRYAWPLNQFIFQLKFQRQLYWAKYLGGLMAYYGTQRTLPQAWIPIPLALGRGQQRGYNQALELARPLSRAFNIPILWSICYRVKATSIQGQLTSYAARYRNLKQAFHITQCHLPAHVALVDDVVTSGATATALASALKAKGVARVDLWCCCRTIRKSVFI
jgi:ComF family protein